MKTKLIKALVLGAAVSMSGLALAEPVALNDSQMDEVSAAGLVEAEALADALGLFAASTFVATQTMVEVTSVTPLQNGAVSVTEIYGYSYSEGAAF